MIADLERVSAPGYLADLPDRPVAEVRTMRDECQAMENAMSYVRRLAQGRLDIVGGELSARRDATPAQSVTDLILRLPDTLAHHPSRGSTTSPRPPLEMEAAQGVAVELEALLGQIAPVGRLAGLGDQTDDQVRRLFVEIEVFEASVSEGRQTLHGLIDHLQAEITRRYRTGEASVDSLLR